MTESCRSIRLRVAFLLFGVATSLAAPVHPPAAAPKGDLPFPQRVWEDPCDKHPANTTRHQRHGRSIGEDERQFQIFRRVLKTENDTLAGMYPKAVNMLAKNKGCIKVSKIVASMKGDPINAKRTFYKSLYRALVLFDALANKPIQTAQQFEHADARRRVFEKLANNTKLLMCEIREKDQQAGRYGPAIHVDTGCLPRKLDVSSAMRTDLGLVERLSKLMNRSKGLLFKQKGRKRGGGKKKPAPKKGHRKSKS